MKIHPSDPVLRKLVFSANNEADPVQKHIVGCSRCFRKTERLRTLSFSVMAAYDEALSAGARRLHALQAAYSKERSDGKRLVAELLKHPVERQLILIHNHPRFHTWGAFERLLEMSLQEGPGNPSCSEELAHLALELSDQLDESAYGKEVIEDLRGRAWAYIGNARRIQSDLRGAQQALDRSLDHLRRGTHEPWERGVWLDLKASLLRAQRRFDEALRLLSRALTIFLAVGDDHRAGRTLLNMDNVLHHAGKPEEGIPLLYRSLELLDSDSEPQVVLMAKHNLIDDLAEAGRYLEAHRLFLQTEPSYRRFDQPFVHSRRLWVEAKISRGLGQSEKAERLLLSARKAFIDQASPYDVALVSLDMAGLYAQEGRTAELKQLAEEMVPIFSSRQVQREAIAAFTLWKRAVEAERAGAEMAAGLAATLQRARYDHPLAGRETL